MRPLFLPLARFVASSLLLGVVMAAVLLLLFPQLRHGGSLLEELRAWREEPVQGYGIAVRRAAPAVVNVYTRNLPGESGSGQTLGSGVIMTALGHVLTNYHVIAGADQVLVALQDGRVFAASLVGSDPYTDLAVLNIEADNLPVIPQNPELVSRVGDIVLAIGNPYNLGQTITQGIISALGRIGMASTSYQDYLQTDAAINAGNSGGALINSRGELVGINTIAFHSGVNVDSQGIGFAIPYPLAHKIMTKLIAHGRVVRGYLGINGGQLNPAVARQMQLGSSQGVVITSLDPQGPAQGAGLLQGDIIVAIDGETIDSVHQALDLIAETAPGATVTLTIYRRSQRLQQAVTIGEPPQPVAR